MIGYRLVFRVSSFEILVEDSSKDFDTQAKTG